MDINMATSQPLNMDDLRYNAKTFAKNNWNPSSNNAWSIGRINKIEFNPGLQNSCPALQKYCNGIARYCKDVTIDTFFAWHGTPELRNIASICYHGFNPSTRKRQVHGTGEYFGVVAEDSHNFSGNTDHLIVVQIINCKYVHTLQNCYVVNNPQHQKYTFVLPVLVITYNNTAPLPIPWIHSPQIPITSTFPSQQQNSSTANPRWHWTKDNGSLEPFDTRMNKIIEYHYQKYLNRGVHVFTAIPIKRYCDTTYQTYIIDFSTMTQQNYQTGFKRCIQRCIQALPQWHWMEDDNVAVPFPKGLSNLIEKQYTDFVSRPNSINGTFTTPNISRKKDNVQQVYQIDFKRMRQINCKTRYERKVTRVMPSPSTATNTRLAQNGQVLPVKPPKSSWKWCWIMDDGNPEPYPDSVRDLIEQHFQLHARGGPSFFQVSGIARKCDNAIQPYTIDFRPPMTQINRATGYHRKLTREMAAPSSSITTSFQTSMTRANHTTGQHHKMSRNLSIQPIKDFSSASTRAASAPCQWYWIKDDGSPEPYSSHNSKIIEHHYKLCTSGGPRSFELPRITRNCDSTTQSYIINFDMPMTQVNQKTGYVRQLRRSTKAQSGRAIQQSNHVRKVDGKWKWYWVKDDGTSEPYIDYISDLIEYNYQLHVKGGPHCFQTPEITRQCDGVLQSYIINFTSPATQMHCMTGNIRKVMRLLQTTVHPDAINNVGIISPAQRKPSVLKWLWETVIHSPDSPDTSDKSEIQKPSSSDTCSNESAKSSIQETNMKKADCGVNDMHFHQDSEDLATNSATSHFKDFKETLLPATNSHPSISEMSDKTSSLDNITPAVTSEEFIVTVFQETTIPQDYSAASVDAHQRDLISALGNSAASNTTPAQETKSSSNFFRKWFSPIAAEINTFFWGNISDGTIVIDAAEAT